MTDPADSHGRTSPTPAKRADEADGPPDADGPTRSDGPTQAQRVGFIRQLRHQFAWSLTVWAVASVVIGVAVFLWRRDDPLVNAAAMQFGIWGLVNLGFAVAGLRQSASVARQPTDADPTRELQSARQLLGALRFNHKLNLLWLAIGGGLLLGGVTLSQPALTGHGIGVLMQGMFLLRLDHRFDHWLGRGLG